MLTVFVTGNLGKDATLRDAGKDKVCSFTVASNRKVKGEDVTTWVSCSLWGKRGESLVQHLSKGKRVAVTGELSTREHDGRTYLECRVSEIDFMGGGKRDSGEAGAPSGSGAGGGYSDEDFGGSDEMPF
jgi:single-strand DNA-binding protein